jgi:monoamine oxidase
VGRVVTVVDWSPGRVRVTARTSGGRTEIVRGHGAIITVPVSLLKRGARGRGALTFSPEVPAIREAADCATMGHVRRVTVLLDRPIVEILSESRRESFARLAFLHAPAVAIPVWWNSYPLRSGIVVGWAGGPSALELEATPRDVAPRAISALASAFALGRRTISRHIRGVLTHDWTKDPFSRGAYSYSVVGGSDAGQRLSRPVAGTLFLAGEAADSEGRSGTVHGAVGSGFDAARRVLRGLGRA